ncbi:MAG: branched chain amino acid transporter substrate-binding protein [Symbiobacteriaceae bacterium]|jgi:branched-chain amino acid transport system substrate-binding protein|nr:branched chain amino acid transporter substrate-binding protein [Symbiobacteriaceae bacterium]
MKRIAAGILAFAMFAVAGCGGAQLGTSSGTGGQSVKIGFIAPLTGDAKTYGESAKKGFDLALEQAGNKAGNFTVAVTSGDDRNDPTEGVNLATKMISQDKVSAIVGAVTSSVTIPVSEVANSSKIVMITGTATAAKVTVDDKGARKPYAFRAPFIDPFQGQVAAKFAVENLKVKTAAILYDKGNDYSIGLTEEFQKTFAAKGGTVVASLSYGKDDTDFSAIVTNVAAKKPDMIYLPDYYGKVSLIAAAIKAKGLNVPLVGADGWDSNDLDFAALAGGYFTNHYSADDPSPAVQKFVKEYEAKYKAKPDAFAALAYDATNMLLEAIKQAGSTDSEKIRTALQGLKEFPAVGGKLSFDANGNPIKAAAILQVQANKSYKFITSVQP